VNSPKTFSKQNYYAIQEYKPAVGPTYSRKERLQPDSKRGIKLYGAIKEKLTMEETTPSAASDPATAESISDASRPSTSKRSRMDEEDTRVVAQTKAQRTFWCG
jgi:hypothetical protein